MVIGARISERLEELGKSQAALAREVGVSTQAIWKLVNGQSQGSSKIHRIARFLHTSPEYLTGETNNPAPANDVELDDEDDDDTVEVAVINEGYGMGGTFIDDNTLTIEKRRFSRAWLRDFTESPPDLLFVTSGIGDSMMPTIHDRDGILVDRGDNRLRGGDRLWAVSFAGTEMIKRLRPRPDGTVIIMSDNKDVSDDVATDGELFIVGRVAAIMRKV